MDEGTLKQRLSERAEILRLFIVQRIPSRYRGTIAVDDVLQETWVSAFQTVSGFKPVGPNAFDRWIRTIAMSKLADALRAVRRIKRGGNIRIVRGDPGSTFEALFERLCDKQQSPSRVLSSREAAEAVKIAICSLPNDYRRVLSMRYNQGYSNEQIAQAIGKKAPAVNSMIFRALRALRVQLGPAGRYLSGTGSEGGA